MNICVVCIHKIEINYNILMKDYSNEFADTSGRTI